MFSPTDGRLSVYSHLRGQSHSYLLANSCPGVGIVGVMVKMTGMWVMTVYIQILCQCGVCVIELRQECHIM